MNKKVIIVAIVLVLILIGGYFLMKKLSSSATVENKTSQETSPSSPLSLKDLISKGIDQSCTFSNDKSDGTVYISGGKVRGDFEATVDGKTTKSHMIVDGNNSYIWSDGSKSGVKMTFDPSNATPSGGATTSPSGSFDAAASMNYNCAVWVVDSSVFTIPTDVQFMTFTPPVPGGSPAVGSNSSQCSYCDSLSGDSKTQCLTALNCK